MQWCATHSNNRPVLSLQKHSFWTPSQSYFVLCLGGCEANKCCGMPLVLCFLFHVCWESSYMYQFLQMRQLH